MLKISFVRTWLVIVNFCVIVVVWSFGLYACACDCGHFLSPAGKAYKKSCQPVVISLVFTIVIVSL